MPGNRLEVELPPGSAGREVTVFLLLLDQETAPIDGFSDLAAIAADSEIQRELADINREFAIADMDGLAQLIQ